MPRRRSILFLALPAVALLMGILAWRGGAGDRYRLWSLQRPGDGPWKYRCAEALFEQGRPMPCPRADLRPFGRVQVEACRKLDEAHALLRLYAEDRCMTYLLLLKRAGGGKYEIPYVGAKTLDGVQRTAGL